MKEEFRNPLDLNGRAVLVTGASSGIGRATAILCSCLGATVTLVGRDRSRLEDTLNEMKKNSEPHGVLSLDLTNSANVEMLVDSISTLDGAVFCVGKGLTLPVPFSDRAHFDEIFDVNFFSTVELIRLLYKKKKLNKGASLVLLSSMGGNHVFSGGNSIYGASKAALNSFMKFAAKEFSARKVRVNSICPGMVDTPLIHRGTISDDQLKEDAKRYPLKRYGQPEDIANAAAFLLSDASSWVTGTSLIIDGGLSIN